LSHLQGSFSKKSQSVKARQPLAKDETVDYENDSDEEWESEAEGEDVEDLEVEAEDNNEENADDMSDQEDDWVSNRSINQSIIPNVEFYSYFGITVMRIAGSNPSAKKKTGFFLSLVAGGAGWILVRWRRC
jgi:hypothetical protein